jgi:hypothetical protein
MPDKTQEARGRRSQARERRRAHVAEPSEDQAVSPPGPESSSGTNGSVGGAAAKMVGTAVAAGLLGALGGAVKAMLERREADSPRSDTKSQATREAAPQADSPEGPSDETEPEPDSEEGVDREPKRPQARAPEGDAPPAADEDAGLSESDAERIVTTARRRLEALVGSDVERVSGLERADGRWSVYAEVVEVARIPESTDVLATYEVVLDDDGDLVGVSRVRRYRRSQVEEEA